MGPFQHSHVPPLLPAVKHCLVSLVTLWKERISCPSRGGSRPLLCIGAGRGGSRQPGADGFCLCFSLRGRGSAWLLWQERESLLRPPQRQTGFASIPPWPWEQEGLLLLPQPPVAFASFERKVQEVGSVSHLSPNSSEGVLYECHPGGLFGLLPYSRHSCGHWVCTELLASECKTPAVSGPLLVLD